MDERGSNKQKEIQTMRLTVAQPELVLDKTGSPNPPTPSWFDPHTKPPHTNALLSPPLPAACEKPNALRPSPAPSAHRSGTQRKATPCPRRRPNPTALLLLLLGGLAPLAHASCEWMGGNGDYTIQGYKAEIDPDVPIGSVLHHQEVAGVGETVSYNCGNAPGRIQSTFYGRLEPVGSYNTWPTSLAGVGVRLRETIDSKWWPKEIIDPATIMISFMPRTLAIEFVKTGEIPSTGGNLTGEIAGIWMRNKTQKAITYRISGNIQILPKPPVCTILTKKLDVPFGKMTTTQFPAEVGGTTPEKPINIRVQCAGAAHGGKSHIYMTLTDAVNPQNRGEYLTLTGGSGSTQTAKGAAVQILNNGTPVKYGPDSRAPNNPNQWFVRETGNDTFDIPLSARYIRTAAQLTPGVANAYATFTMSYQ